VSPRQGFRPAQEYVRPSPHLTTAAASTTRTERRRIDLETFLTCSLREISSVKKGRFCCLGTKIGTHHPFSSQLPNLDTI
jgi:hypothetical protein